MVRRTSTKRKTTPAQTALARKAASLKVTTAAPALDPVLTEAAAEHQVEAGLAATTPFHKHDRECVHAAQAPPGVNEKRPARTKKTQRALFVGLPPAAYSISAFCVAHDLSESFFHKLKKAGKTPREMRVNGRILITHEAAADWRRDREIETEREEASSA
jgi:hypothetical protein